jgi:single-stranded-DNA-specific exonuclease
MADPMMAFNTLSTKDEVLARTYADNLAKINDERKLSVAHIMKEVKKMLGKREEKKVIVIGNPAWRIGVLGIVASKIVEEYQRPVFVWGSDGSDLLRGSCRSWGNVNLVDMMNSLPENSITSFGGHAGAGGFSVSHEEIHFLEERILKVYSEGNKENEVKQDHMLDATISIDDVNNENYKVIESLAPYGTGNPKPMFLIKEAQINTIKEFGKEKNHLELTFKNSHESIIKAITFFKTRESFSKPISVGDTIDMIVSFEKSTFGGRTELRLRIVDVPR